MYRKEIDVIISKIHFNVQLTSFYLMKYSSSVQISQLLVFKNNSAATIWSNSTIHFSIFIKESWNLKFRLITLLSWRPVYLLCTYSGCDYVEMVEYCWFGQNYFCFDSVYFACCNLMLTKLFLNVSKTLQKCVMTHCLCCTDTDVARFRQNTKCRL